MGKQFFLDQLGRVVNYRMNSARCGKADPAMKMPQAVVNTTDKASEAVRAAFPPRPKG